MVTRMIFRLAILLSVLVMSGCSSFTEEMVQRTVSSDGQFWAEVSVNRGSALKADWYAVSVGKVHPGWLAILPRQRGDTVCSLQGPGKISVSWNNQNQLLVSCGGCKQADVHIFRETWDRVHARFEFR
jgi:hypothetical protein